MELLHKSIELIQLAKTKGFQTEITPVILKLLPNTETGEQ